MKKGLVILFAYLATVAVIPLLVLGSFLLLITPHPDSLRFSLLVQTYAILAFSAFLISLPGFTFALFCLRTIRSRSYFGFGIAGALNGILTLVFICLPDDNLWILRDYKVVTISIVIGTKAGLIYRQTEVAILKYFSPVDKTLNSGANGK